MRNICLGLGALILSGLSHPAAAQLPPELLGGGGGDPSSGLHSEPFYKGAEGFWVLMRNPGNDGYRCSVNFISDGGLFAIHGPWNAEMAKQGAGMIWFDGKDIPKAAQAGTASITVRSKDPVQTYPAIHTTIGQAATNGVLILIVNMKAMLAEKNEADDIAVDFGGKQVFHTQPIRLQEAYAQLGRCVAARAAK